MKFKPSLVAVAVLTLAGSVQAQTPAPQTYLSPTGKRYASIEQYQIQTVLNRVGAPGAWSRGYTGKGVSIAIIDNGFDLNTYDLKGAVGSYRNFYVGKISDANTGWGEHGTGMASIAAGRYGNGVGTVGVAYDATLLLAQAGQGGRMPQIDDAAVIRALNWAGDEKAVAVNMSFSSAFNTDYIKGTKQIGNTDFYQGSATSSAMYGKVNTLKTYFTSTNTTSVIVAAAGNQGLAYSGYPGAFATATNDKGELLFGGRWLIVGAVDTNNNIASYSNRAGSICTNVVAGACKDLYSVKDFYVVAPGGSSLKGDFVAVAYDKSKSAETLAGTLGSGTSQATAIVTGGIAIIKQAWPQLSAAQIVQLVKTTATDLGKTGVDEVYGWGMVNFDKATQPQGLLKIANFKGYASAIPLSSTGVASSGSASINSSSVLKNVQGLDSYNRNYTLDMTRAVVANPVAAYRSSSSYLALSPAGYHEMSVPVNENYSIKMMQSQAGNASEITYSEKSASYSVQFGTMTEKSGFLGNYGAGAMAFGDSSTSYLQLGTEHKFDNVTVFGSYGLGVTRTGSVEDSMIRLGNRISSDTWRMGVAKNNVFQNKDAVSLSVVSPVSVRNGSATVTGVTGYEFTDNGDGADARAIVSTETINLRAQVKPMDLVLGYTVIGKGYDRVNVNVARQFNVGGVAGNTANSVGVLAVKSF